MNNQIMHAPPTAGSPPPLATAGRPQQPENPLLLLHRFLRGRYPLAIALAVLFGVPGAIAGYLAMKPTFASSGVVRVAPTLPRLMYTNEDNQVPPMFDSFVATQAATVSGRRVIELAVSSDELRSAGWPTGPEGVSRLSKALKVNNRRGSELISVEVQHTDPRLAQIALNAVLAAYEVVHAEMDGLSASDRETQLRERQTTLQREIDNIRTQIADLGRQYGTDDLDQLHSAKVAEITRLDSIISEMEIRLASMPQRASAEAPGAEQPEQLGAEVELERLAARDRILARHLDNRAAVQVSIEARSSKLGPEHRSMTDLIRQRDALDAQIAERVAYLKEHEIISLAAGPEAGTTGMTSEQLQESINRHRQMRDRHSSDAMAIGRTRLSIIGLKDRMADRRQYLDETTRRLEQIEVESRNIELGRISIMQRGDYPTSPAKDRRIPLAAFGGMGGVGLGVGLVVLLSLARGGYRYIDDVERALGASALLGTVPDLSTGEPENTSLAALSVHHLRNMLQLNTPPSAGGTVYGVTSPTSGDGKTSLALSLAMSFAATGHRTLLIDADLIGRGLTRQLKLSNVPGLCQALKATKLNGEVHSTRVANLSAVPVGHADDVQPEQISSGELSDVLTKVRAEFDTVIVDTGPILGSLEANLVSPMCDRVVMVVARGQNGRVLRSAMERLARIGATCGGLVFNRAEMTDFNRSVSAVSLSGRSLRDHVSQRNTEPAPGALALLAAVTTQQQRQDSDQTPT